MNAAIATLAPLIVALTGVLVGLLERNNRLVQRRFAEQGAQIDAVRVDIEAVRIDLRDVERHLTLRIDRLYDRSA